MRENLSIITNFGCKRNCWYCVWRTHTLRNSNHDTNWEKLENFLIAHKDNCRRVSVSGGGEPLYELESNWDWWNKARGLVTRHHMSLSVHTREQLFNEKFWGKYVEKCVFSSDCLEKEKDFLLYVKEQVPVRIAHVVQNTTTMNMVREYEEFARENGMQLTLKELVGYDDGGKYAESKKNFPHLFHLDHADYNLYYMPDNTITDTFLM